MEVSGSILLSFYIIYIDYNISIKNRNLMFDKNEDNFNVTFKIMASKR